MSADTQSMNVQEKSPNIMLTSALFQELELDSGCTVHEEHGIRYCSNIFYFFTSVLQSLKAEFIFLIFMDYMPAVHVQYKR